MAVHARSVPHDVFALCAHGAAAPGAGDPLLTPIVQSTTYRQVGLGGGPGHAYSRVSNPTVSALEAALGSIEDAPPGACFGTGLGAEFALFLSVLRAGDHCVCGDKVYGGTTRLLRQTLADLGVRTTFVDATDPERVRAAITPQARLIFVETPANPTLELTDIRAVASIAKEHGVLLAVDNTFLTGVIQRPLDLGADVSVYSTTKFIDGHSAALGGALVARDESLLERIRFIRKCTGGIQSPQNAWLTLQGLKTLPLRLERQCRTAVELASWLTGVEGVVRVYHPSLSGGDAARIASSQHTGGLHGGVVSLELDTERVDVAGFLRSLRLCSVVEHVGSVETLVTHPGTMTHADVPREQRLAAGLTDGLLRVSVGLEGLASIQSDLLSALRASERERVVVSGERGASCVSVA